MRPDPRPAAAVEHGLLAPGESPPPGTSEDEDGEAAEARRRRQISFKPLGAAFVI
jgi:hypothetical protein